MLLRLILWHVMLPPIARGQTWLSHLLPVGRNLSNSSYRGLYEEEEFLLFYKYFLYEKMCCKLNISTTTTNDLRCAPVFQVGALASLRSGAVNPHDGRLTFVGRVLASLPVDIRVGKLLMLGHVFGLLDEAIIIGEGQIGGGWMVGEGG